MIKLTIVLCCILCLCPTLSFSQFLDVKSLKGIDSLSVWIESLNENIKETGITKEGLKSDLSDRLAMSGLRVVEGAPDNVYLTVSTIWDTSSGLFACNVKLDYLQGVWLERTDEWNYASTWFREYLGIYTGAEIAGEIGATVADLTDLFIHDALTVNPGITRK